MLSADAVSKSLHDVKPLFDDWSPALLARLDQWRRCQYDRPDRCQAIQILVAEALKVPVG